MLKLTVETDTGHKAEVRTSRTVDGGWVVKMAAHWRNVLTPAVTLKHFAPPSAEAKADAYAQRLVAAILGEEAAS